jgi:hypothetical protein
MAVIAGDAHTPIYGYQWRAYFTTYKTGVPTAPTSPDSEYSLDGATLANCANETVAIKEDGGATDSPNCYLDLTAGEMTAGNTTIQVKSAAIDTKTFTIYPRVLPVWLTGTSQAGGSTTTIKLAAGAPAYDLSGCWVGVDSGACAGQVRKISSYNTTDKIATVKRAFSAAPDAMTYSVLVPEAMQGALATRAMLALPANAPAGAGGLPTVDANNHVNGVVDTVSANLVSILGEAITGTAAQIVAAFTKWFDVATPTGTVNSLPDVAPLTDGGLAGHQDLMATRGMAEYIYDAAAKFLTMIEETVLGSGIYRYLITALSQSPGVDPAAVADAVRLKLVDDFAVLPTDADVQEASDAALVAYTAPKVADLPDAEDMQAAVEDALAAYPVPKVADLVDAIKASDWGVALHILTRLNVTGHVKLNATDGTMKVYDGEDDTDPLLVTITGLKTGSTLMDWTPHVE